MTKADLYAIPAEQPAPIPEWATAEAMRIMTDSRQTGHIIEVLARALLSAVEGERQQCLAAVEGERLTDQTGDPEDDAYSRAIEDALNAIRARSNA